MADSSLQTALHLRSLTIRRYEQFEDCPPIEFSPGENLILGINGAGKTRLLWLIHAVLRFNYEALIEQAFDVAFEISMQSQEQPDIVLRGEVRNQPSTLSLEPPWDLDAQQRAVAMLSREPAPGEGLHLRFRIETAEQKSFEYSVERGRGVIRRDEEETVIGPVDKSRPLNRLVQHLLFETPGWMPDVSHHLFDAISLVVFFVRETDADFMALVEQFAYKWERGILLPLSVQSTTWLPLINHLVSHLANHLRQGKRHDQPEAGFAAAPMVYARDSVLAPLLEALSADEISFRFKITREDIHRPGYVEGRGIEIRVRFRSGVEVADSALTFGQRRLITIGVIALLRARIPILVDELDNGLHPGMVEAAMGFIAGRQSFIASHNRLVVDLVDYDSPEDLQRKVHICRRAEDGSQRLVQLSDEEARDVFEKIDVGIMHPSDVLRTEGLW